MQRMRSEANTPSLKRRGGGFSGFMFSSFLLFVRFFVVFFLVSVFFGFSLFSSFLCFCMFLLVFCMCVLF